MWETTQSVNPHLELQVWACYLTYDTGNIIFLWHANVGLKFESLITEQVYTFNN